jgi:hypothetical protein
MSQIFEAMISAAPTLDAFAENAVSFITFNYDRYMAQRFIRVLKSNYQTDGATVWAKIRPMFIHVYGSRGALPDQGAPAGVVTIPFGAPETDDTYHLGLALQAVENSITIVHDAAPAPPTFGIALQRFQTAQQCLFLGFGFGEKNVERLQTAQIPMETRVDCTTYGMTMAEVQTAIYQAFPGRSLMRLVRLVRNGSMDTRSIEQFLRDSPGF